MATNEERVKKVIEEQLGVTQDQLVNTASFKEDLGADSLDRVELVMALEKEFAMQVPDDEAEELNTVQQAIDYVNTHIEEAA